MELIPDRATYRPGSTVTIEFGQPATAGVVVVTHLERRVALVEVAAGATSVTLGVFEPGGYGVRFDELATAFDVIGDSFERPRYGFVARLTDDAPFDAVERNFRRLHLNLAQLYDWAYRHTELMPPEENYVDPLGQERTLSAVNQISRNLTAAGTVPLGYTAVYAIGHDETDRWRDSIISRPDGEPYRLGEAFLVLVDPAEPEWLEHYLGELQRVVESSAIEGFHLDQYGWPKFATRGDGQAVDLAASFTELLDRIRERLPHTPFMFNNVNDFPTYATARAPQSATYIEVWEPHSTLYDLAALAATTLRLRPEHPPILSAYLPCYAGDERRANNAAALLMATVFSSGATNLLLGEDRRVLTGPYYPDNHEIEPETLDFFARWCDFQVRYGDLLYDPEQTDVTETFTGGINEDLVFDSPGVRFSTKADAGTVWTRVVRTRHGIVAHLVNLTDQTETTWDAGKNDFSNVGPVSFAVAALGATARVLFTDVDAPDMVELTSSGVSEITQSNALSAGQASVTFELPAFRTWAVVLIPASELG